MNGMSVQEAANYLKVSERTIRRKIKSGQLNASQLPTSQGYEWRIYIDNVHEMETTLEDPKTSAAQVDSSAAQVDSSAAQVDKNNIYSQAQPIQGDQALVKALEIVEKLQRENLELAGQVGYFQAKLQDAQEQIRLLASPQNNTKSKLPWWKKVLGIREE